MLPEAHKFAGGEGGAAGGEGGGAVGGGVPPDGDGVAADDPSTATSGGGMIHASLGKLTSGYQPRVHSHSASLVAPGGAIEFSGHAFLVPSPSQK